MSRRREATKRNILPDPKYISVVVAKFINTIMLDGKKSIAEKVVYGALDAVAGKYEKEDKEEVLSLFQQALDNVAPMVEVKSRRVGGATYQVPVQVRDSRRIALAMRWLTEAARKRSEKSMYAKLSAELLDAIENKGGAVRKKEDTHRMAEANKAFSHFSW